MQTSRNTIPVLMEPESVNIPNVLTIISGIQKAAAQHGANTRVYLDTDTLLKDQQGSSTVILTGFDSPRQRQIQAADDRADAGLSASKRGGKHCASGLRGGVSQR